MTNLARKTDPITSHIAANKFVASGKHKTSKAKVLAAIEAYPGCTAGELSRLTGIDYTELNRRASDLVNCGKARRGQARLCQVQGSKCTTLYPA